MMASVRRMGSRLSGRVASWPTFAQGACLVLALVPVYDALYWVSRVFWFLPAGARFAAFLLLPRRFWPWLLAGFWLAKISMEIWTYPEWTEAWQLYEVLAIFPQPLATFAGVRLFTSHLRDLPPDSPVQMAWLIACMLTTAAFCTLCNLAYIWAFSRYEGTPDFGFSSFAVGAFVGDLSGMLMLAPIALTLVFARRLPPLTQLLRDGVFGLVVPFGVLAWLNLAAADPMVGDYTRVLVALPALYFGFRYGWRGAAVAASLIGLALVPFLVHRWAAPDARVTTQLLFVLIGLAALLLGAAMDAQHESHEQLAERNAELESAGAALRDAAQRNLSLEEDQRRKFAAELHDELGQNLTAVQTRIKLAEQHLNATQAGEVTASIYEILATMRRSVHGLMGQLRPTELDDFGLLRALAEGAIREHVEAAGLRYGFRVLGDAALIDALNADRQLALYRIVQEAATNTIKHAHARRFDARLRMGKRAGAVCALLDVRDDGIGMNATRELSGKHFGLQGLRDRVVALDGVLRVVSHASGTQMRALLRQATGA